MIDLYKTLLNEWNLRNLPEVIDREIDLVGYSSMVPRKIINVTGFRRTGKTYLVFGLINNLFRDDEKESVVYINFEDERIPLKTEFLTNLIPAIKQHSRKFRFLFLDELQNIPNWSKWLRRVYDSEDIRIFVIGSSSKLSSKEVPTELRGRFIEIGVFPLNFREFLNFKGHKISYPINYTANEKAEILGLLNEYLRFGGLPEVVLADEERKSELIHSYYDSVIRRDIIERFHIRNEESLKVLIRLLLNSTHYTISKLYNTLKSLDYEVGKSTIQNFLSYIENSYFIYSLSVFSPKVKDQLQWPRKVYFIDNAFLVHLSNKFSDNLGRLYENIVFLELKRKQSKTPDTEIFYWRNVVKEEVDFVIRQGLKVKQLIQVCYEIYDYDTKKMELRALLKASKELDCNDLLVITEDYESQENFNNKNITYLPLWKWLIQR